MADVVIIDYGMGNIHSVYKSLVKVIDKNSNVKVSNSLNDIKNSSHITLVIHYLPFIEILCLILTSAMSF